MPQLCLWTKIRNKQWLGLGASAFHCIRVGFLCPKCDNFGCLHISQYQNKFHLKRWLFFAKIGIFCMSIAGPLSAAKTHWMVRKPVLSVPRMRQFYLFRYPPRSKWASSEEMIFLPKIGKSICCNISQRCSSILTTIFVRRKDKTNYLSNQTWAKCYHLWNRH